MTVYGIEDGHGNEITTGLSDENVHETAQRIANRLQRSVFVYEDNDDMEDYEFAEVKPESREVERIKRHGGQVVTWQSPRGDTIEICTRCTAHLTRAKRWPKDGSGGEYCQVHRGEHAGTCGIDLEEEQD